MTETPPAGPAQHPVIDAPLPLESPYRAGRRRRGPILIVVATVLATVVGAGAYAGMRLWVGSGAQPEDAMPAGVMAFARVDLSPGYGQRLKINNLAQRFPRQRGQDAVGALKQGIFDALSVDEETYRAHVQPWFADRIGVAWWRDAGGHPFGLVALAASDESAATRGLGALQAERGRSRFGFVLRDGYALVTEGEADAQAAAAAAGAQAERESLSQATAFRRGAQWLPGHQTALAWVDFAGVREWAASMAPDLPEDEDPASPGGLLMGAPFRFGPGLPGEGLDTMRGTLILGAQATDEGLDIRFRAFGTGATESRPASDLRAAVGALPGNSVVAGSFQLTDLGFVAGLFTPPDPEDLERELPPDVQLPPDAGSLKEMREQAEHMRTVEKALAALAGAQITVAVSTAGAPGPGVHASAQLPAADKAVTLAEALKLVSSDLTITRTGDRVEVTTRAYQAGGGPLSAQDLYRRALAGGPDQPNAVLFVDVQRLAEQAGAGPGERLDLGALKAVGLTGGVEDGDPVGLVRILIG
jgi:hypothetical protein